MTAPGTQASPVFLRIKTSSQGRGLFGGEPLGSLVPAYPARPKPAGRRKILVAPPAVDMGLLRVEDLESAGGGGVAGLRGAHAAPGPSREREPSLASDARSVPRRCGTKGGEPAGGFDPRRGGG